FTGEGIQNPKGPVIACCGYSPPARRNCYDIDLCQSQPAAGRPSLQREFPQYSPCGDVPATQRQTNLHSEHVSSIRWDRESPPRGQLRSDLTHLFKRLDIPNLDYVDIRVRRPRRWIGGDPPAVRREIDWVYS